MSKKEKVNIFWFRRDIRLEDNTGLFHALEAGLKVVPVFIFDKEILDKLENKSDRRVDYFYQALEEIHAELKKHKSGLTVFHDKPVEAFKKLIKDFEIDTVFCNRDYEPQAIKRDEEIQDLLKKSDINFQDFKDQVIFEKDDVVKMTENLTLFTLLIQENGKKISSLSPSKKWKLIFQNFINIHLPIFNA
jgi:deoxyribodipyrimidine photo-lyase